MEKKTNSNFYSLYWSGVAIAMLSNNLYGRAAIGFATFGLIRKVR
jgi:hypothetical protein